MKVFWLASFGSHPKRQKQRLLSWRFAKEMKVSALLLMLLALACAGKTESDPPSQFDLCVRYCTLKRSGSEETECYEPVEECEEECTGVTHPCALELVQFTECQVAEGAGLICRDIYGQLISQVDYIDDACLSERRQQDECFCELFDIPCEE